MLGTVGFGDLECVQVAHADPQTGLRIIVSSAGVQDRGIFLGIPEPVAPWHVGERVHLAIDPPVYRWVQKIQYPVDHPVLFMLVQIVPHLPFALLLEGYAHGIEESRATDTVIGDPGDRRVGRELEELYQGAGLPSE